MIDAIHLNEAGQRTMCEALASAIPAMVVRDDLTDARKVVAKWRIGYGEAIRRGEAFQEMVEAVRMGIAFARDNATDMGEPIPMILHCPACHHQHVDEATEAWPNPPHRSHECQHCHTVWRPADVPTAGVPTIMTIGKADTMDYRVPVPALPFGVLPTQRVEQWEQEYLAADGYHWGDKIEWHTARDIARRLEIP